ncbi:MAG: alpha/beta hydrolase [Pseudomonadota bacterium]
MNQTIKNPVAVLLTGLLAFSGVVLAQTADRVQATQEFASAKAAGNRPDALAAGQRALQLVDADPDAGDEERIDLLLGLAEIHQLAGDYALARPLLERALTLRETLLGADNPDLLPLLDQLVVVAQKQGDVPRSEALLLRTAALESAAFGERSDPALATLARLQQFYALNGRSDDAARIEADIRRLSVITREAPGSRGGQRNERRYRQEKGSATVRVFYGTNRAPTGEARPASFYGKARGDLQFGYVDVSIPEVHREGELETQSRWSIFTFTEDATEQRRRYVLTQKVAPLTRSAFATALHGQVAASSLKDVFIFVHGFNSSFDDAARRTAQLAYDLDFDGVPLMYSWPSQASTTAYTVDEAVVGISGLRMAEFLDTVVAQSGAQRVHLIAHSMGNRTLVEALQAFRNRHPELHNKRVFGQVVFTAPDMDRDYFLETVTGLQGYADRVTLYASNSDLALKTSQKIHGAPRAGLAGASIVTAKGLDTIDMSGVKADMLGHNYYAADAGAIYDLFRLLWRSEPPPQRCGMSDQSRAGSSVWIFNVSVCAGQDLLQAGVLVKRFGERARGRVRTRIRALTDPTQKQEWSRILTRLDSLLDPAAAPGTAAGAKP